MKDQQLLAELLASLDEHNRALTEIAYTISENSAVTRMMIDELIVSYEREPKQEPVKKEEPKKKGFDIFEDDFEEALMKDYDKASTKINRQMIKNLDGRPLEVISVEFGENMTQDEIAKEIKDHIAQVFKESKEALGANDEENDDDESWI